MITDKDKRGYNIYYFSELTKIKSYYPNWETTRSLEQTIKGIMGANQNNR